MFIQAAPLLPTATALRSGQLDLLAYVAQTCERVEALDGQLQALVPEAERAARLRREALALQERFPVAAQRPPLYGVLVGVKDIYHVDGFPTRAGSRLPPEVLAGAEASAVRLLKQQGALILGKTVTAEFAYLDPGPTRNPHDLEHTPGGSSSGSAAAVAAGFCSLALGTQTIGSVIRPAAFCGIVGFKPSYGRISTDGILPVSNELDHAGLFAQDVAGMALAASLLCRDWRAEPPPTSDEPLPILGIPVGPYLEQATVEGLDAFASHVALLEQAGFTVRRVPALDDVAAIAERTVRLMAAGMAETHANWFARFEPLYSARSTGLIRAGQTVAAEERAAGRAVQTRVRVELENLMKAAGIDLWISPAATGPAPRSLATTGDSAMNLPWTLTGVPTITFPGGASAGGLPVGLQCSATFMADERLLLWSEPLSRALQSAPA